MKNHRTHIILGAIFLTLAALVLVYANRPSATTQPATREAPQTNTASLTVQDLYAEKQVSITTDETVLQVLKALDAADPQLQLATKEYSGMGTLVTGMGKDKNGVGNAYWQYKVNGVMPPIGADAYKLKSGDMIDWFFGPSQE